MMQPLLVARTSRLVLGNEADVEINGHHFHGKICRLYPKNQRVDVMFNIAEEECPPGGITFIPVEVIHARPTSV